MRNFFRGLLFVVVIGVAAPSFAEEVSPSAIRELMDRFGINAGLVGIGEAFREGVLQSAPSVLPAKLAEALAEIGAEELNGQRLRELLEAAFLSGISESELDALNTFVTSPLGARITALEVAATSLEAAQQMLNSQEEFLEKVQNDPALAVWIERLDRSIYASEITATAILTLNRAMVAGSLLGVDEEQLLIALNEIESSRDQVRDDVSKTMVVFFASTYAGLTDDEFEQYVLFLESSPAQQMYGLYLEQMVEFYRVGGDRIGQRLSVWKRQRDS